MHIPLPTSITNAGGLVAVPKYGMRFVPKKVSILSKLTQYIGLQVSDFEELGKRWLEVCADIKQQYGFTEKE